MPELPEVETVRRGAEPLLVGRRLRKVELRRTDLRWPVPVASIQALVGRRCTAIERRSKYLLLRFDGGGEDGRCIAIGRFGAAEAVVVIASVQRGTRADIGSGSIGRAAADDHRGAGRSE